ncbi:MAG: PLP-dependent aminotransferase family protein [Sphingomonadaceae bacterium]|nr:PLP-dependent aminotransferase family protein [Sphingomonadaceae bacterium]
MVWTPEIDRDATQPLYRQLVDQLAADIRGGQLKAGTRLPPQRDLAHRLAISIGAVTHAYMVAEQQGLVVPTVGRGTYVADSDDYGDIIDLSINVGPINDRALRAHLHDILRGKALRGQHLDYQPVTGAPADRQVAAAWLMRTARFDAVDWQRLCICSGGQNALAITMAADMRAGDILLCDALTYPGVRTIADQLAIRLHPIAMDHMGTCPDALDRAAQRSGARHAYILPTLHNPTGRTMDMDRRQSILTVARRRNLMLFEADLYGPYAPPSAPPPLYQLAPDRCYYLSSLSKTLSPALRTGYILAPDAAAFDRLAATVRALHHSPSGLLAACASHLLASGAADALLAQAVAELANRHQIAERLLPTQRAASASAAPHLWIESTRPTQSVTALAAERILVSGSDAFAIGDSMVTTGIRICLGAAPSQSVLAAALQRIAPKLANPYATALV